MLDWLRRYYMTALLIFLVVLALAARYVGEAARTPVMLGLLFLGALWPIAFLYLTYRDTKARVGQKIKMYCICSREALGKMKGIRGKMITQGGHAYLHAFWDAEKRFPHLASAYQNSGQAFKITVVVETEDDLIRLEAAYRERCGVSLVRDAGLTVFKNDDGSPNPTITYLGLGPVWDGDLDLDISGLKTLT